MEEMREKINKNKKNWVFLIFHKNNSSI